MGQAIPEGLAFAEPHHTMTRNTEGAKSWHSSNSLSNYPESTVHKQVVSCGLVSVTYLTGDSPLWGLGFLLLQSERLDSLEPWLHFGIAWQVFHF